MNARIRPATTEDIDEMLKLLCALFAMEKDFTFNRAKQEKGLTMMLGSPEERIVLVAEKGHSIAGMVTGQMVISTAEGGLSALVEDLVVAPSCRGKGIGTQLLHAIENWAISNGATRLQLLADADNGPALKFYDKVNWKGTSLVCRRKIV